MQKYAQNMQLICSAPWLCLLCENMQKYAKNMQLYARYANMIFICKICTPHFADGLHVPSWRRPQYEPPAAWAVRALRSVGHASLIRHVHSGWPPRHGFKKACEPEARVHLPATRRLAVDDLMYLSIMPRWQLSRHWSSVEPWSGQYSLQAAVASPVQLGLWGRLPLRGAGIRVAPAARTWRTCRGGGRACRWACLGRAIKPVGPKLSDPSRSD